MPVELAEQIFYILNDVSLMSAIKTEQEDEEAVFSAVLHQLDEGLHNIYTMSNEVSDSIKSACEFLMKCGDLHHNDYKSLIDLAKQSIIYIEFLECKMFPARLITFVSELMCRHDDQTVTLDIEHLLTSCMCSKSEVIRAETYGALSTLVNDLLNMNGEHSMVLINKSAKRLKCQKLSFLLYNKVFYTLITQGLFDSMTLVQQATQSILSLLLKCELMVTDEFREKLTQLILIYMPFLQCHGGSSRFGNLVVNI
jgi:hypothetical protein